MRFMVYYKYDPEVKERLSKFVGKHYGKGVKLVDLKEAAVINIKTGDVMPTYVAMCKASLLRYLQTKHQIGKYATCEIGWNLK